MLSFTFAIAKEPDVSAKQTLLAKEDCRAAIALAARKKGVPYTVSFTQTFENKDHTYACTVLLRAEQGDKDSIEKIRHLSAAERQAAEEYQAEAKHLRLSASQGDIDALIALRAATSETAPAEYVKRFYKYFNIQLSSDTDFPVTIFDVAEAPVPAHIKNIYWLNDATIVYETYEKPPAPLGQGQFYAGSIFPISLDLKSLSKERLSKELLEEIKESNPEYRFLSDASDWCQKMFPGDLRACYKIWDETESVRQKAKSNNNSDTFDPKIIVIKRDTGEEKTLVVDKPIYPPTFHYDKFSRQYWASTEQTVWKYDEKFNLVSVSNYPNGWWSPSRCYQSHWSYSWEPNCFDSNLEHSTKYGFLIVKDFMISDIDKPEIKRFNAGGILLTTPQGKIYKLQDMQIFGSKFSVSPDGCHALFVKDNGNKSQNLAMIELCSFFEKSK